MRLVFAGTPEVAAVCLRRIVDDGHDVALVVTREDAPYGRRREMRQSPVADAAEALGLPIVKSNRGNPELLQQIAAVQADVGVVVAYGVILKTDLLRTPRLGWVNLHFSLLPQYRGASPVQHAILDGSPHGVTVFRLDEGIDTGPIVAQRAIPVTLESESGTHLLTADVALRVLARAGAELLTECLDESRILSAVEQRGEGSAAPKTSRADGRLSETDTATSNHRRFLAMTPEPGAWLELAGGPVKIHDAEPSEHPITPGRVEVHNGDVFWGCAEGSLVLKQVQPAGKPRMEAAAWFRGLR